jgi:uncharacterized protein (DUF1800 family)
MAAGLFSPLATGREGFPRRQAEHLLRRAGFGASRAEVDRAVEAGLEGAVEGLFAEPEEEEAEFQRTFEAIAGSLVNFEDVSQLQSWWVHRMVQTRVPLREKLTLFWHGHFATSYQKVGEAYLLQIQNDLFRRQAWGTFSELVQEVARDPAMLVYLDGESNSKEHPNENFARELMELFTCGIGNYTEEDVQQAARAFTGWHRNGASFVFNSEQHDFDRKRILGKTGKFDGGDVVQILMQQPATSRFMARKLLRYFAASEPSEEAVAEAAALFDRTQLNVEWFLRELFLSEYFYSEACMNRRIASPAEFVVGSVRTLNVRIPANELRDHMAAMGQELYAPPNVKGWDGEQAWINSARWPARMEFARQLAFRDSSNPFGGRFAAEEIVPPDEVDAERVVDHVLTAVGRSEVAAETRKGLAESLVATEEGPRPDRFRDEDYFRYERTRNLVAMVLSLPENQLI